MLTITRERLVAITQRTLKRYKRLTDEQRADLMRAAETAPAVLLGGWRSGRCGCLVGTAYPELFGRDGRFRDYPGERNPLVQVGMRFNGELFDATEATEGRGLRVGRVRVTD